MTNNTDATISSSPPSFMVKATKDAERAEQAKQAAASAAEKELNAQELDEQSKRFADIAKCTSRIAELVGYAEKILKVVDVQLPAMIAKDPAGRVVDAFVELETQVYAFEQAGKDFKEKISRAREVSFPERLEAEDVKGFTSNETGHRLSRSSKVMASIPSAAQAGAYDWLRVPVFYEPLTEEQENMAKALKERVEAGESVDPSEFPLPKPMHPYTRNDAGDVVLIEGLNDEEIPTFASLIKPTVNSSSLSSLAKELLGQGKEMPPGLFTVYTKDTVSITKGKASKK